MTLMIIKLRLVNWLEKTLFIAEYNKGYLPTQIFIDAGFDVDILCNDRIYSASKWWHKSYRKSGELGLRDTRKFNSGRPCP
ncbi:hypothetical protein L0P54_10865 [Anaerosalibacter bizertensis]|uniref:Uncharacterized protein n=2 Tax=Anaerosalibacter bizertensis TaxID=932217 RepID=A0A9Q4FMN0_9FIRM|nr:hypothetical protein [Anaerosalibacter bizertensis]MBV1819525.1 hypothetical protein [Bacteroidales bacterium MSK.15.36]HHV25674.1 hypothetical protein [Tissierellia bacterium]MCB5558351.1 hypothetical protein [Anaerosalibacter bizertensis]MCG4565942.1 hypothetical protein [Anaerosalibacter bizertensis]MCG4583489.1 hypothetical protein [Anaerosalibacter bizertensis]